MIYVFLGPTLGREEASGLLPEAILCPPAAQGDVWRAARMRPRAIGIIDGYFERVPAIWHKEILWAMSQGVHVYGGASMGALRAAELEPYGMLGVGEVYEAYRSGRLERDDEVAVLHGDADSGYRRLSVALVDVRATLQAAERAGVLAHHHAELVLQAAAERHYPERCWPLIVRDAEHLAGVEALDAFVRWLPSGERSRKAEDARALLALMKHRLAEDAHPKSVTFEFEHTYFWSEACRQADRHEASMPEDDFSEALLDELRLMGASRYEAALAGASARFLASEWARERGFVCSDEQAMAAWGELIQQHGLEGAPGRQDWCARAGLEPLELLHWMRREATYRHALRSCDAPIRRQLADVLRASGDYPALVERARRKRVEAALEALPDRAALLRWHYEERLGGAVPELQAEVQRLGLADEDVWLRVLSRERAFMKRAEACQAVGSE